MNTLNTHNMDIKPTAKRFGIVLAILLGLNALWFLLMGYWVSGLPGYQVADALLSVVLFLTEYIAQWPALVLDYFFPSFQASGGTLLVVIVFAIFSSVVWTALLELGIALFKRNGTSVEKD